MSLLYKAYMGFTSKNLSNILLPDIVLTFQFFDNVFEPNETGNFQRISPAVSEGATTSSLIIQRNFSIVAVVYFS